MVRYGGLSMDYILLINNETSYIFIIVRYKVS